MNGMNPTLFQQWAKQFVARGGVTKANVGLGNCDNTSDLNKPVSTAQQTALDEQEFRTFFAGYS